MALNPSLLRFTTPPDGSFDLHLPAGTATLFEQRVAAIPETKRGAWRYHRVAADDTLASVARAFHVNVSELAAANQMGESDSLNGIEALVVPVAPAAAPSSRGTFYTTRRGDTLVSIADRFGVSLSQLRRWNSLAGIRVAPGRRLHVAEPARVVQTSSRNRRGSSAHSSLPDPPPSSAKKRATSTSKKTRSIKPASASGERKPRTRKRSSHRTTSTR